MHSIENIREIIQQELNKINYDFHPKELYEPIEYSMSMGGKRLRPVLVLMACDMFGGDIQNAIYPALGLEMFHNFTLVHDDLMDDAPLRRNKVTVFKKWDVNVAVLSGDAMFAKAYELVGKTNNDILVKILPVFTQTAIEVCEGQQYDMNFETRNNVSIEEYITMIRLKTAVLIAASLKVGALTGGATDEEANNLYKFGENIGITFQLQDDLLDVFANQDAFGKQLGGDIVTNKKTFLLLKALELANPEQRATIELWLNKKDFNKDEKVKAITQIYRDLNIEEQTRNMMLSYYETAVSYLDKVCFPVAESQEDRKILLRQFADELMVREY